MENNPNSPGENPPPLPIKLPPLPNPKKETVRISLPPRPTPVPSLQHELPPVPPTPPQPPREDRPRGGGNGSGSFRAKILIALAILASALGAWFLVFWLEAFALKLAALTFAYLLTGVWLAYVADKAFEKASKPTPIVVEKPDQLFADWPGWLQVLLATNNRRLFSLVGAFVVTLIISLSYPKPGIISPSGIADRVSESKSWQETKQVAKEFAALWWYGTNTNAPAATPVAVVAPVPRVEKEPWLFKPTWFFFWATFCYLGLALGYALLAFRDEIQTWLHGVQERAQARQAAKNAATIAAANAAGGKGKKGAKGGHSSPPPASADDHPSLRFWHIAAVEAMGFLAAFLSGHRK